MATHLFHRTSTGGLPNAKKSAADGQSTRDGDQQVTDEDTSWQGQEEEGEEGGVFVEEVYKGSHTFLKVQLDHCL